MKIVVHPAIASTGPADGKSLFSAVDVGVGDDVVVELVG